VAATCQLAPTRQRQSRAVDHAGAPVLGSWLWVRERYCIWAAVRAAAVAAAAASRSSWPAQLQQMRAEGRRQGLQTASRLHLTLDASRLC